MPNAADELTGLCLETLIRQYRLSMGGRAVKPNCGARRMRGGFVGRRVKSGQNGRVWEGEGGGCSVTRPPPKKLRG